MKRAGAVSVTPTLRALRNRVRVGRFRDFVQASGGSSATAFSSLSPTVTAATALDRVGTIIQFGITLGAGIVEGAAFSTAAFSTAATGTTARDVACFTDAHRIDPWAASSVGFSGSSEPRRGRSHHHRRHKRRYRNQHRHAPHKRHLLLLSSLATRSMGRPVG